MMRPEDKTQEIAERAERLQEIGSSILRAARDELYLGMRFLDVALSRRCLEDCIKRTGFW